MLVPHQYREIPAPSRPHQHLALGIADRDAEPRLRTGAGCVAIRAGYALGNYAHLETPSQLKVVTWAIYLVLSTLSLNANGSTGVLASKSLINLRTSAGVFM